MCVCVCVCVSVSEGRVHCGDLGLPGRPKGKGFWAEARGWEGACPQGLEHNSYRVLGASGSWGSPGFPHAPP